ncbi:ABC transporter ATP-binding protein [Lachnospiraceae bacterium ZAX-1]
MLLKTIALMREYQRGKVSFRAVNEVDLSLDEADFVCITGHSGSGKSTLLNLIAGLLSPTSGNIVFDGKELTTAHDRELSRIRNTQIGYIPQGHSILGNFTVLDNVRLPFYLYKRDGNPTVRANELLEQVGIAHLKRQYPAELSGGELRRISIARALINSPRILIADEPTGDLDPQNSEAIMELFARVAKEGTAVLVVTHDVGNVRFCDKHYIMEAGKLRNAVESS